MAKKLVAGRASFVLPPNANAIDRAKYDLCRHILIYMHAKGITQRALAEQMGIPETRVREIVHYCIEKFTLDRLLGHYEKINPKVVFKVA